jgi:hypothetical protein
VTERLVVAVTSRVGLAARVGVWRDEGVVPSSTFVAKLSGSFAPDGAIEWADTPLLAHQARDEAGRLLTPYELGPARDGKLDLVLTGGVRPPFPSSQVELGLRLGDVERRYVLRASEPAAWFPLEAPYLTELDGTPATLASRWVSLPEHPSREPGEPSHAAYAVAPEQARFPSFSELPPEVPRTLELDGFLSEGPLCLELPRVVPKLALDRSRPDVLDLLQLELDTLHVDLEARSLSLLYRARWIYPLGRNDARLAIVVLDADDAHRSLDEVRRDLPRATFSFVAEPDDLRTDARDHTEEQRLLLARYESWEHEEAPEPILPLAAFAEVSAELAEKPPEPELVLARFGLEPYEWDLEQRAWLEKIAASALEGDGSLGNEYGELFQKAQDALAKPEEAAFDAERYARTAVMLERSDDEAKALASLGLSLASWMRIDRRLDGRAAVDEAFARSLDEAFARARAERPERRAPGAASEAEWARLIPRDPEDAEDA